MKRINNLTGYRRYNLSPQVGDAVYNIYDNKKSRKYLAVRIGPDYGENDESWLAWNPADGTMSLVSVGFYWKLVIEGEDYQT